MDGNLAGNPTQNAVCVPIPNGKQRCFKVVQRIMSREGEDAIAIASHFHRESTDPTRSPLPLTLTPSSSTMVFHPPRRHCRFRFASRKAFPRAHPKVRPPPRPISNQQPHHHVRQMRLSLLRTPTVRHNAPNRQRPRHLERHPRRVCACRRRT